MYMKKTILITWGTGYIWSHWVVAFEQAGYKTVIVDNLCNSSVETLDGIEKIIGYKPDFYDVDLRDKDTLEEVFSKYDFDWVIHFAGLKAPFESQEQPIKYFQNNISWSINLFDLMDKYKVLNIVFSSSANTYSTINVPPIKETDLQWTTNPYGTTKLLLEKILEDLSKFSNFNVINLRYFNPIWAHESGYLGELPEWKPNNLFPFIFKVLTWDLDELQVFGWDYDTVDGTWVRDYIDVVDLVNAHVLAYNKITNLNIKIWFNENFNVWTGEWVTVLESIEYVEKIVWKKVNYKVVDRRLWDIPVSFCNTNEIEKELWFRTKVSLNDSIENSWNFYNK